MNETILIIPDFNHQTYTHYCDVQIMCTKLQRILRIPPILSITLNPRNIKEQLHSRLDLYFSHEHLYSGKHCLSRVLSRLSFHIAVLVNTLGL